jgi:hypothetical protein
VKVISISVVGVGHTGAAVLLPLWGLPR